MDEVSDRNLLFGILAVQLDYVRASQFMEAANQWMLIKSKPLGSILVAKGFLSDEDRKFLDSIVEKHISRSGSAQKSLESLQSSSIEVNDLTRSNDFRSKLNSVVPSEDFKCDELTVALTAAGNASIVGERFTLIRELARGGLGEVFVARDRELDREVALKKILDSRRHSQDIQDRFIVEAKITGGLEHPGIVPVYGFGALPNGVPFYVMRLIRGQSLHDAIQTHYRSKGKPSNEIDEDRNLRSLIRAVIDTCNAVGYAHSRGVIHRDLKPHNVMLGKYGETLVVDWGLAKAKGVDDTAYLRSEPPIDDAKLSDSAPTAMGSVLGTYAFMSPEQANGRIDLIDRRSDVFSLGATLYSVITGRAPYNEDNRKETLAAAKECEIQPPRELNPRISKSLQAICLKAMSKERGQRYGSALELAEDLENWIAGAPVKALPETFTQQVLRSARKHQTAVASVFVFLFVAFFGLLLSNWAIAKQRNIAVKASQLAIEERNTAEDMRKQSEVASQRAQHNTDVSIEILEQFVKNIVGDKWAGVPNLDEERLSMVELALKKFIELSNESPSDLKLKKNVCQLYIQSGNLYRNRGNDTEATTRYDKAYKIAEQLNQATAVDSNFLFLFFDSLNYLATSKLAQLGALQTLPYAQKLLAVCQQRENLRKTTGTQNAFILAHLLHSAINWELNKPETAISEAKSALDLVGTMTPPKSQPFVKPIFHAQAQLAMANAQFQKGELTEALAIGNESYKTAIEGFEKYPDCVDLKMISIEAAIGITNIQLALQDIPSVEKLAKTAIGECEVLCKDWPKNVDYKRLKAESHLRLCLAALQRNDYPEALAAAEQSQQILDDIYVSQPMNQLTLPIQLITQAAIFAALDNQENSERRTKIEETVLKLKKELKDVNRFHPALKIASDVLSY